ncbi:MAG: LCP family protein [Acidimicrobiales bacterium]|nr:LCP family protein [Acidimicrobiales bacterium]
MLSDESAEPVDAPASRPAHRTWPQRAVLVCNSLLVVACLAGAGGLLWFRGGVTSIPRLALPPQTEGFEPEVVRGDPVNFLLVGIDDASGLAADDPARIGRDESELTDTIMILRVDPWHEEVSVLSLPRDLYVPIPPDTRSYKINSAFAFGGMSQLIATINQNFGIPIHHFAVVDFAGFQNLVDTVGGVPIYLPWPVRDDNTGLYQEQVGCVTFNGDQALDYVRSRYFQVQIDGTWVEDTSSDIGRARRQQEFMRASMRKAIDEGARNPVTLGQLVGVAQQFVTLDEFVSPAQLVELGQLMEDFNPDDLAVYTFPGTNELIDRQWVYQPDWGAAEPILEVFRWTPPADGAEVTTTTAAPFDPSAPATSVAEPPASVTTSTQPAFVPEAPPDVVCE